jgi:hypothetical protein
VRQARDWRAYLDQPITFERDYFVSLQPRLVSDTVRVMPDTHPPTNLKELLAALEEAGDDLHLEVCSNISYRRLLSYERHGYIGITEDGYVYAKEAN